MMIFYKHGTEARANTKDKSVWKKRFALFPVCVSMDDSGQKKYVWLGSYEVRVYQEENHGWWKEYRLPGSDTTWKVDITYHGD
jgi:hypothetical protein